VERESENFEEESEAERKYRVEIGAVERDKMNDCSEQTLPTPAWASSMTWRCCGGSKATRKTFYL